jgi:hypothetical protein
VKLRLPREFWEWAEDRERPPGPVPKASETCPLCQCPPHTPHTPTCPWMLWLDNPRGWEP